MTPHHPKPRTTQTAHRTMENDMSRTAQGEATASAWNKYHRPGTAVLLVEDDGQHTETSTRSEAWVLGHGEAVVSVVGKSGCYQLSRIVPVGRC